MSEITENEFEPLVPFMPKNPMYAHAYVPYQINFKIVSPEEAFEMGTIFPDLYGLYREESRW